MSEPIKRVVAPRWSPGTQIGRTPVRSRISGAGAEDRIIECTGWTYVQQASPASVGPSNPTRMNAFSNGYANWDSVTNGKKMLFKLAKPYDGPRGGFLTLGALGDVAADVANVSFSANSSRVVHHHWRARAITADFDITNRTWNNSVIAPDITIDAIPSVYIEMGLATTLVFSGSVSLTYSNQRTNNVWVHGRIDTSLDPTVRTIYGFIVECTVESCSAVPTSQSLTVEVGTTNNPLDSSNRPFVLLDRE